MQRSQKNTIIFTGPKKLFVLLISTMIFPLILLDQPIFHQSKRMNFIFHIYCWFVLTFYPSIESWAVYGHVIFLNVFTGSNGSHKFSILPSEIQQCLAKFDNDSCLIFFLTSEHCGTRTRHDLGIPLWTNHALAPPEPYFNPVGSSKWTDDLHES